MNWKNFPTSKSHVCEKGIKENQATVVIFNCISISIERIKKSQMFSHATHHQPLCVASTEFVSIAFSNRVYILLVLFLFSLIVFFSRPHSLLSLDAFCLHKRCKMRINWDSHKQHTRTHTIGYISFNSAVGLSHLNAHTHTLRGCINCICTDPCFTAAIINVNGNQWNSEINSVKTFLIR